MNFCVAEILKKSVADFFFFFTVNVIQGRARSEMTLFLKEFTFFAIGKKALSCWGVPCIGCLKQSFLTLPGSEILDLQTDTLICKECLNGLEKIDY